MKAFKPLTHMVLALCLVLFSAALAAAPIQFETDYDNSSVDYNSGWFGSDAISLSQSLKNTSFSLDVGESMEFAFLNIKPTKKDLLGTSVSLSATLAFLSPEGISGDGSGSAYWKHALLFTKAGLRWDEQPGQFELADGSLFTLEFVDLPKGKEWWKQSHIVNARVTVDRAAQVPEPGTLALMALALIGLGLSRRIRPTATTAQPA